MRRITWIWAVTGSAIGASFVGAYIAGRATADGIPSNPAMYYSGILEESDARPSGTRKIKVGLYASDGGGTPVCETASVGTPVIEGAFRVGLPEACTDAVHANPDIWVRVTVDDMYSLPYTKLGAVPYAVEAKNGVPVGTVIAFAGSTVPPGWLACKGQGLRASSFPALFGEIGTDWGNGVGCSGGGSGDFCLPDLRGRFLRGADSPPGGLDATPNRIVGHLQSGSTALPLSGFSTSVDGEHTHTTASGTLWSRPGSGGQYEWGASASGMNKFNDKLLASGGHQHTLVGGDFETRPANAAVNYIIKY